MSLVSVDPHEALERAADPGEFVMMALEHGKSWLAEALAHGDLEALVNAKGYAETLRVATVQKQLGKDAELSAQELVRRAERCIGLGIRQGQEAGEIRVRGQSEHTANQHGPVTVGGDGAQRAISSPSDFATRSELTNDIRHSGIYAMTDDVSDDEFETAITGAKTEKNLSRANVVRKLKGEKPDDRTARVAQLAASGHTTEQIAQQLGYSREGMTKFLKRHGVTVPADAVVGRSRRLDSDRIVRATVESVDGIGILFDQIDYLALDAADVNGWLPILDASIRSLTTLRNQLRKVSQP